MKLFKYKQKIQYIYTFISNFKIKEKLWTLVRKWSIECINWKIKGRSSYILNKKLIKFRLNLIIKGKIKNFERKNK